MDRTFLVSLTENEIRRLLFLIDAIEEATGDEPDPIDEDLRSALQAKLPSEGE